MKRVAVSQRVDDLPERNERRDALDQALCRWLLACGCLPLPVPNGLLLAAQSGEPDLHAWLSGLRLEAVVLSGGNDLGQAPERDATERALLVYAEQMQLPVLGICRGMQMLADWAGTGLRPIAGHVAIRHRLRGEFEREVNSFHRFALTGCPAGYRAAANSDDGCIEAISHESRRWEGWMWHPEREAVFQAADGQRLQALFGCR